MITKVDIMNVIASVYYNGYMCMYKFKKYHYYFYYGF